MNNQTNLDKHPTSKPQGKQSNTTLIIILVVAGVLILGGIGTYFIIASKATSSADTSDTSATTSKDETGSYAAAKDLTPDDPFAIEINNNLKPIFASMFGGAKLNNWVGVASSESHFQYAIKKPALMSNSAALTSAIETKGYVKSANTGNINTSTDFMFTGEGNGAMIMVGFNSATPNQISVVAYKSQGD